MGSAPCACNALNATCLCCTHSRVQCCHAAILALRPRRGGGGTRPGEARNWGADQPRMDCISTCRMNELLRQPPRRMNALLRRQPPHGQHKCGVALHVALDGQTYHRVQRCHVLPYVASLLRCLCLLPYPATCCLTPALHTQHVASLLRILPYVVPHSCVAHTAVRSDAMRPSLLSVRAAVVVVARVPGRPGFGGRTNRAWIASVHAA